MIQVLERAFSILEKIAENPETPLSISEMAGLIDVKSPTCYHIVNTLAELGYLEQPGPRKGYKLGPAVSKFAHISSYRKYLVDTAAPLMKEYCEEFGETILLAVIKGPRRYVLCQFDAPHPEEFNNDIVIFNDVYLTATGRLLLSYYSNAELEAYVGQKNFPQNGPLAGMDSLPKLREALQSARQNDYLICEWNKFITSFAFTVFENEKPVAALGSFIPQYRLDKKRSAEIVSKLSSAANLISKTISK